MTNLYTWDIASTDALIEVFLDSYHMSNTSYSLLRFGENAVYKLEEKDLVVRVHRPGKEKDQIKKEVEFSNYLCSQGFPSVKATETFSEQPISINNYFITIWDYIPHNPNAPIEWIKFGQLLRNFHDVASSFPQELPLYNPFIKMKQRINSFIENKNNFKELEVLVRWVEKLESYFTTQIQSNELSVLHGDAHKGNVILFGSQPILLDYENVSRGLKEWDLIPIAVTLKRFNLPLNQYMEFCEGYGSDVRKWRHFQFAQLLRELYMTIWLYQNAGLNEKIDREIQIRMKTWLGDGSDVSKWNKF